MSSKVYIVNPFGLRTGMDVSTVTSEEISKIFTQASISGSPRAGSPRGGSALQGYRKSLNRDFRKREL